MPKMDKDIRIPILFQSIECNVTKEPRHAPRTCIITNMRHHFAQCNKNIDVGFILFFTLVGSTSGSSCTLDRC